MSLCAAVCRLALGSAALVLALSPSALAGGPPWISVELPADPTNQASRGAVVLVRAYSCGAPTQSPVTATADGVVQGERRTIDLQLEPAGSTGVYAVRKQWPSEGVWVLTFRMSVGGEVSTLVTLGPDDGRAVGSDGRRGASVRAASIEVVGRKVSATDVDAVLRAAARGEHHALAATEPSSTGGIWAGGAGLVALAAGSAGVALRRRRERSRG